MRVSEVSESSSCDKRVGASSRSSVGVQLSGDRVKGGR